jgi:hypothetical protein
MACILRALRLCCSRAAVSNRNRQFQPVLTSGESPSSLLRLEARQSRVCEAALSCSTGFLAHLGLARVYALKGGSGNESRG